MLELATTQAHIERAIAAVDAGESVSTCCPVCQALLDAGYSQPWAGFTYAGAMKEGKPQRWKVEVVGKHRNPALVFSLSLLHDGVEVKPQKIRLIEMPIGALA